MFQTLRRAAFPALGLAVAAGLAVKVCCHDGGKVEISPELTNKKQIDRDHTTVIYVLGSYLTKSI